MLALPAHAQEISGVELSGNGFLTLGAGAVLGGTRAEVQGRNCPCYTTDYAQSAVYDGRGGLQWAPESKLGLQGTASLQDTRFSVTAQAVIRSAANGQFDLEWLYGNYQIAEDTSIQFGRKRLPMFYFSDIQDVGFSLPWTHLPPQFYGWEAVNYNGLNLRHETHWGGWSATFNALAGNESIRDSGYWKMYNGRNSRTRVKWSNIIGGDMTLVQDWFETRLSYIQSATSRQSETVWSPAGYVAPADPMMSAQGSRQQIYAVAVNLDPGDWIVRSEFLHINRPGATFGDYSQLLALGHRFGDWQWMATVSRYQGRAVAGGDPQAQEGHVNRAITGRYSLSQKSDIKVQFDSLKDHGGANWTPRYGDARLLSMSYDMVF